MNCEAYRQQSSLMMDAEPGGLEPAGLFAHLGGCAECRQFFDSLIRLRGTARRDREDLLRQADELLPARLPLPAEPVPHRVPAAPRSSWRLPGLRAPAALAFAVLLLVAGVAIGATLAVRFGRVAQRAPVAAPTAQAAGRTTYIYVCSMPQIDVTGSAVPASGE